MQIVKEKLKKTEEIFKILELTDKQTQVHLAELEHELLMDMAAECMAEKNHLDENSDFAPEKVEEYLLSNYEAKKLDNVCDRVMRDVVVEYFSKITKDTPEDKMKKIDEILRRDFE